MSYEWREPSPLELAQGNYSDFYKDMYGFRPALPRTLGQCERGIASLKRELSAKAGSFAGRMGLRYEGWGCDPESDPELAKQCAWLMAEHEREMASWYSYPADAEPAPLPYEEYEVFA